MRPNTSVKIIFIQSKVCLALRFRNRPFKNNFRFIARITVKLAVNIAFVCLSTSLIINYYEIIFH